MDISALKRRQKQIKEKVFDKKKTQDRKSCSLAIRLDTTLHYTIRNYLASMHNSGDYTYSSLADILRKVIDYMQQKNSVPTNSFQAPKSEKNYIELSLRVLPEQKQYWQSLPDGCRRRILETNIITFLQKE